MVKPQFEVGRERVGKGGVVRDPALRREALVDGRAAGAGAARRARLRVLGAAGPGGQPETFAWLAEPGRPGARRGPRGRGAGGGAVSVRVASVLTHRRAADTAAALAALIGAARAGRA